jgi:hypothetical protein
MDVIYADIPCRDEDGTKPGMVVIHDDPPLHDEDGTKPGMVVIHDDSSPLDDIKPAV